MSLRQSNLFQAASQIAPKAILVAVDSSRLQLSVVVKCKVSSNVLPIKSILQDTDINIENVSLLGDKRVLISFDFKDSLDTFLNMHDAFQDFFLALWRLWMRILRW